MARLPDETTLGPLDADSSRRPIATYDTTGYARGAAAIGEGFKDLGAGIATAGKALGAYAAQKAAAEQKLELARRDAELTAKNLARTNAIERETDPAGMVARHANEAAKEFEQAAQRISDPQQRANLRLHRDGYVAGVTRVATEKETVLSASSSMADDLGVADTLGNEALESKDPAAFNRAADVYHGLVDGWQGAGWIDQAKAVDLKRNWATDLAERALLQAPAADRLAAVEAATRPAASDTSNASADNATQPAAGQAAPQPHDDLTQLARLLPAEVQARVRHEARAEVEREKAEEVGRRVKGFEDGLEKALNDPAAPPPDRAAIETDPHLDEPTRTRLLKQYDATKGELNAYRLSKAEYDNPKGRRFNINDDQDRAFADKIYLQQGATPAALHVVVSRTGILPDSARGRMLSDFASGDATRVRQTVEQLSRLVKTSPNVLIRQEGGEELQYAVTQFRYDRRQGATPDEAVTRIIQLRSPEFQKAWAAQRKNIDIDAEVVRATSMFDLDRSFEGDSASMATAFMTYRELVKQRYVATKDMSLAKAQAIDLLKPVAQRANLKSRDEFDDGAPSLAERLWLNQKDAYYRGTLEGSGYLSLLADARKRIEAGADPEELLKEFYPALLANRPDQKGHRRAALEWLKNAPQEHKRILADLARYDAMKGFSSTAEAVAAFGGQVFGNARAPENLALLPAKGATTLGGLMLKGAASQGLFSLLTDPLVQKQSIAGGGQEKYDPLRTVAATGLGAFLGGVGASLSGQRLVPKALDGSTPVPHAPEALPPSVRGEEPVSVVPKSEAQLKARQEGDVVKASHPLRQAYVKEVSDLVEMGEALLLAGGDLEQVARAMQAERRAIGVKYKDMTPPALLEKIHNRNLERYGDKLGPTIEWLRARGKSWDEIMKSAARTGGKDIGF